MPPGSKTRPTNTRSERMDALFIAGGMAVFGLFALYTILLRRV
jgi:hypothetical protein